MNIERLALLLSDMPRLSSPKPRLKHGTGHALFSLLNLAPNLCILSSFLSLVLFLYLPPLLTSPTVTPSSPTIGFNLSLAYYQRYHFSISSQNLLSRVRGYLSELRRATCPEKSHSSFCNPFFYNKFLAAATNLSLSTATDPDKLVYPCQCYSTFLTLAWIFSCTFSTFPVLCIPFLPSGGYLLKLSSLRWESFSALLLPSSLSLSPPASQSFLNASFYHVCSSLWNFNSILSPFPAGFRPGRSTLDQILFLCQFISDGFNKPKPGSRTILATIDFAKAFNYDTRPFSTNLFRLISLIALFVGLNLSFLIGSLVWYFKITKVALFESVEVFYKDSFLALYFSLFHLWSFCFSAFFRQLLSLRW